MGSGVYYKAFEYGFTELGLNVVQIEKLLGYKDGESHETIAGMISDALTTAEKVCTLKAEYKVFPSVIFNSVQKTAEVGGIVFSLNKIVFGQLKRSGSIAVFLSTAGGEIGRISRDAMKEGDLLKGYIYDVIGSEAADGASALLMNQLESDMAQSGRKITNRYSPGYCRWDVAEQHKLFSLMPHNYCGIELNESALMQPEKSVSGFIGVGENVKFNPYTCSLCDLKDCIYRKERAG